MVAPISGARPIHSLTGPASAVAASASAPRPTATMVMEVIQGGTPCLFATVISGAIVNDTIAAAEIGSRMARPI